MTLARYSCEHIQQKKLLSTILRICSKLLSRQVKNILSISKIFEFVQNIFMKQMVRALVLINCGLAANLSVFCVFGQAQRTFNATLRTNFSLFHIKASISFSKKSKFFSAITKTAIFIIEVLQCVYSCFIFVKKAK